MNLRSTASPTQPFFPVVSQYLEGYSNSYEIQTQPGVDPALTDNTSRPERQLQLFRILQEALSNARKHGAARRVEVAFTQGEECFACRSRTMGCGFDPERHVAIPQNLVTACSSCASAPTDEGRLQVQSAPGCGTPSSRISLIRNKNHA